MASKRRLRRKGCEGKRRHATLQDAKYAVICTVKARGLMNYMRAYKCPFGNHYHIGHPSEKQLAAARA